MKFLVSGMAAFVFYVVVATVTCLSSLSSGELGSCQGAGLKYLHGDALTGMDPCLGPDNTPYPTWVDRITHIWLADFVSDELLNEPTNSRWDATLTVDSVIRIVNFLIFLFPVQWRFSFFAKETTSKRQMKNLLDNKLLNLLKWRKSSLVLIWRRDADVSI